MWSHLKHLKAYVICKLFEHTCIKCNRRERYFLKVFADMEELEINPNIVTVKGVTRTYRILGLLKSLADAVEANHPPIKGDTSIVGGGKYRIRVSADGDIIKPEKSIKSEAKSVAEVEEDDVEDSDSDDDDFIYEAETGGGEKFYLLNSDNVLPSIGHFTSKCAPEFWATAVPVSILYIFYTTHSCLVARILYQNYCYQRLPAVPVNRPWQRNSQVCLMR